MRYRNSLGLMWKVFWNARRKEEYSEKPDSSAAFITGNKDIDAEWDNYLKELDAMGLGEVCAIYEAAYARSLANK